MASVYAVLRVGYSPKSKADEFTNARVRNTYRIVPYQQLTRIFSVSRQVRVSSTSIFLLFILVLQIFIYSFQMFYPFFLVIYFVIGLSDLLFPVLQYRHYVCDILYPATNFRIHISLVSILFVYSFVHVQYSNPYEITPMAFTLWHLNIFFLAFA